MRVELKFVLDRGSLLMRIQTDEYALAEALSDIIRETVEKSGRRVRVYSIHCDTMSDVPVDTFLKPEAELLTYELSDLQRKKLKAEQDLLEHGPVYPVLESDIEEEPSWPW